MNWWRDSRKMRAAMIMFGLAALLPSRASAQYASEWYQWHGQEWNSAPGWPPPEPALGYQYGSGYPVGGYYYPDPGYGYPYHPEPYRYDGYSAGFSDGFTAGFDHGFTGGLNNAFAGAYAVGPYGGYYGYGAHGHPYPYQGY